MQLELLSHLVRVRLYCPAVKGRWIMMLLLIKEKPKLKGINNTRSQAAFLTLVCITSYIYYNTISSCVGFFSSSHHVY